MSMRYIREFYRVPAKRGMRVTYSNPKFSNPKQGIITGSMGAYLRIRLDGEKRSRPYHPTWEIQYHVETGS